MKGKHHQAAKHHMEKASHHSDKAKHHHEMAKKAMNHCQDKEPKNAVDGAKRKGNR